MYGLRLMNKKRIVLLFISVLAGSTATWYYHNRVAKQSQHDSAAAEQEVIATAAEEPIQVELAPAPSTESSIEETQKTILVKNSITDKMLSYKKGFLSYIPEFKVVANNVTLAREEQQPIEIPDRILKVTYSYNFANGYRTGTKTVIFSIPENLTEVAITFDWKNDWRVVVDGAHPLSIIE